MKMSPEVKEVFEAFSQFQAEVKDVIRDSQSLNYKYAKLEQIVKIRETMSKFGLSFTQLLGDCSAGFVELESVVMHKSGQYFSKLMKLAIGSVPVGSKSGKETMSLVQHIGSAITFARKYSLLALAGMAQEDDDAALPEDSVQHFNNNRYFGESKDSSGYTHRAFNVEKSIEKEKSFAKLNHLIEKYGILSEKVNEWKSYFKVNELKDMSVEQLKSIIKKVESHYENNPADKSLNGSTLTENGVILPEIPESIKKLEAELNRLESAGTVN